MFKRLYLRILRDYFAGQAIVAIGNARPREAQPEVLLGQWKSEQAYTMADFMLKARENEDYLAEEK